LTQAPVSSQHPNRKEVFEAMKVTAVAIFLLAAAHCGTYFAVLRYFVDYQITELQNVDITN
jgi:hypothetical protein